MHRRGLLTHTATIGQDTRSYPMTRRLFWLQNRPENRCSAKVRPTIFTQSYSNFGLNRRLASGTNFASLIGDAPVFPDAGHHLVPGLWPGAAVERLLRIVLDQQLRCFGRGPVSEQFGELWRHVDPGGHARCGDDPAAGVLDHPFGCGVAPQAASPE
jgi:hypothetical protein